MSKKNDKNKTLETQENTVFITGGAGYIGSHAVKLFLKKGYQVVVFDNLSRGYQQAIDNLASLGNLVFIKGDLRDKEKVVEALKKYRPKAVLHFAALCSVDESVKEPALYYENNVAGTLSLLSAMNVANVDKIIFSSTCAVYGESQKLPIDESHAVKPANPYGESKLLAEMLIQGMARETDLNYVILRYFNVCGSDGEGLIGDNKKPPLPLVQAAVKGAQGIIEFSLTCPKVETRDGTPVRDYVDVGDLVDAHYKALEYLESGGKSEIVNIGTGRGFSVKEIVSAVEETLNIKLKHGQGEARKGECAEVYADNKKAEAVLSWLPQKKLSNSISNLDRWYKKFPDGYKE